MGRKSKEQLAAEEAAKAGNVENVIQAAPAVSVDVPAEKELVAVEPSKAKRKTVLEYLAEFENRKVLEVPREVIAKYPDMHFQWVLNNDRRISLKEGLGYQLVRCPELIARRLGTKNNKVITDDLVKYGDLVLMMVEKEYYEARQLRIDLNLKKMLRQAKSNTSLHDMAQEVSKNIGHDIPVAGNVTQSRS